MPSHTPPASVPGTSPAPPAVAPPSRAELALTAVALVVFGAFTLWVMAGHGVLGFLALAGRDWWGLQMLLDLMIALLFALRWVVRDARARGITAWPYAVAALVLGSPGLLIYAVRRGLTPRRRT